MTTETPDWLADVPAATPPDRTELTPEEIKELEAYYDFLDARHRSEEPYSQYAFYLEGVPVASALLGFDVDTELDTK